MADEYEVDYIVEGPNEDGMFLIKWKGYDDSENTWEPREHLGKELVEEFLSEDEQDEGTGKRRRVGNDGRRARRKQKGVPGVSVAAAVNREENGGQEPKKVPKLF